MKLFCQFLALGIILRQCIFNFYQVQSIAIFKGLAQLWCDVTLWFCFLALQSSSTVQNGTWATYSEKPSRYNQSGWKGMLDKSLFHTFLSKSLNRQTDFVNTQLLHHINRVEVQSFVCYHRLLINDHLPWSIDQLGKISENWRLESYWALIFGKFKKKMANFSWKG